MATTTDFAQLLKRLEQATVRLEDLSKIGSAVQGTVEAETSSSSKESCPAVKDFDELIQGPLKSMLALSDQIGGLLKEQALLFKSIFDDQRSLIITAGVSKKPELKQLESLLKPTSDLLARISEIRDRNRASNLFNHLSTISEGAPALGWVAVEPKPAPYIAEMKDASQFYANRILKEYKDKDKAHVEWVASFSSLLGGLEVYVKKHHTTGLAWNRKGGDISSVLPNENLNTRTAPCPPPPPPVIEKKGDDKPDMSALFGQLNQGGNVTAGLRKVDKSEMTHKNPSLRSGGVVKASNLERHQSTTQKIEPTSKPPTFTLEGNKWCIENQKNNKEIVVDQTELRQTVYVYACENSTIQVKGKVNTVVLDKCRKCAVVLDNVVSSVEVVNSQSVQVQIIGRAPTAVIDKTDGILIYLSKECLDIEIFSAKSSELNISFASADGDDYKEHALPEQILTVIENGSVKSKIVEHKG